MSARATALALACLLGACRPDAPLPPPAAGTPVAASSPAASAPATVAAIAGMAAPGAEAALARLNAARAAAGLAAVVEDPALSRAAAAHADYLRLNVPDRRTTALDVHAEREDLPGYSAEGAAIARTADVGWRGDLFLAVDSWLGTLYHRLPLLEPRLARVGLAMARGETSPINVMAFATAGPSRPGDAPPVAHPSDGEAAAPICFTTSGENPDPVPGGSRRGVAYPITLTFPTPVALVAARLADARGGEVPCHASDPLRPATTQTQGWTICLIPHEVLRPGERYRVTLTAARRGVREAHEWSFRTAAPEPVAAQAAALRAANRKLVRLVGTIGQPKRNAFVELPIAELGAGALMIQLPAWERFLAAGFPPHEQLAGRRFEAVGVVDVDGDQLSVSVLSPSHLRLDP